MKLKSLVLSAASLFLFQAAFSQFHFGVKGGSNIMKVDGQSFKNKFSYGYHLGGFAEIGLGKKFSVQPEVLYNQYTTSIDSNYNHIYQNVFNSSQTNVKLNYLSFPVLLNYKVVGDRLVLQAGPQFSILRDQTKNLLQNGKDAFAKGDLSMLGGAQVRLGPLSVTGRYVIGLKNISELNNSGKWRNQGFQVSVGLGI